MKPGSAQIVVEAPPDVVYGLVSDLTRMGEYSPECYRCRWLDGADGPTVGVRFRGSSKFRGFRWSRTGRITRMEAPSLFQFETLPDAIFHDATRWTYRFEPVDGGTLVTESYELIRPGWLATVFDLVTRKPDAMVPGMRRTLERIKAVAEAGVSPHRAPTTS